VVYPRQARRARTSQLDLVVSIMLVRSCRGNKDSRVDPARMEAG
jgi:hypothetical protein